MTLSLWDLKLSKDELLEDLKTILTLSLWDLKQNTNPTKTKIAINFDFVPMGFETIDTLPRKRVSYKF